MSEGESPVVDPEELARLRARDRLLDAILDASVDAVFGVGLDDRVTVWSPAAAHVFGYDADEARGLPLERLLPGAAAPPVAPMVAEARAGRRGGEVECAGLAKDGVTLRLCAAASPLFDGAGAVSGFVVVCRDIRERIQSDRAQRQLLAELERSNHELEQFAYAASHDLQEPLRMVASYTELLDRKYRGQLDEKADQYLHYAKDGADRMQGLIKELLALSRVGRQGATPRPLEVEAALAQALASLSVAVREAGARVTHDPLPVALADESQLVLLFLNLVGNALKFRRDEPLQVHVAARSDGDMVRIEVRDNGIGIDPGQFERIFVIFQRLHRREDYPGNGMGLAIAKKIVQRLGGRIGVESTPGEGSTFFFTLPRVDEVTSPAR